MQDYLERTTAKSKNIWFGWFRVNFAHWKDFTHLGGGGGFKGLPSRARQMEADYVWRAPVWHMLHVEDCGSAMVSHGWRDKAASWLWETSVPNPWSASCGARLSPYLRAQSHEGTLIDKMTEARTEMTTEGPKTRQLLEALRAQENLCNSIGENHAIIRDDHWNHWEEWTSKVLTSCLLTEIIFLYIPLDGLTNDRKILKQDVSRNIRACT